MGETFLWEEAIYILKNVYWAIMVRGKNVLSDGEGVKKSKLTIWEGINPELENER